MARPSGMRRPVPVATPGIGGGGGAVAGDDVDDAGVVDQVDVVGARIGDGDAVGAKRDAAGIIEDGSGGGDVVRVDDGAAAGDDAALPAGVDLGDVVDRAAHGDEEVVEAVDRHGIDVEQTGGIGEIDGAVRAEADDGAAANPADAGVLAMKMLPAPSTAMAVGETMPAPWATTT